MLTETLTRERRVLGPENPLTMTTMANLGRVYLAEGQLDQAKPLLEQAHAIGERVLGPTHLRTLRALDSLGRVHLQQKNFNEAAAAFRQSLELRRKDAPDGWETASVSSWLGETLTALKQFEEAEPLLLAGYSGLKNNAEKIPAANKQEIAKAFDRITQLYAEWNQPVKTHAWEQKLAESGRAPE